MKKILSKALTILCLFLTQAIIAQQNNSLRYEIMLSNQMLESSLKNVRFSNTIDISPNKYITLSTDNKIYLMGWGGIIKFGKDADSTISSYAYTSDGLLMAVVKNNLCYMGGQGAFMTITKLPASNMGLAAGKDVMYLFDRFRNDHKYKLYVYGKGGKYRQLLVSPKPVTDVAEMGDSLYIAIGSGVFSFSPNDNKLNLVAGFQKESEIKSMTVDTTRNILYLATRDAIYAIHNNCLVYVTGDFGGGIVKYFDNGLVMFNPETDDIIRVVNIDKFIVF